VIAVPHCPTCTCGADHCRGQIDREAPFYALVIELDEIVHGEQIARGRATAAAHR
jgi:hypothetical protein